MVIILSALLLSAADFEPPDAKSDRAATDPRYKLEMYVYETTTLCDMKVDEIASAIPPNEVANLRDEHDAWKLDRDTRCAEVGRNVSGRLRELKCLLNLSGEYLAQRKAQLAEIEAEQINDRPEADVPPN